MNIEYEDLIKVSGAWILENPDAKNIDVPIELLDTWLDFFTERRRKVRGVAITIFLMGLSQQENIKLRATELDSSFFPYERLMEYFNRWKFKLVMAKLYHAADPHAIPMVLFKFDEFEVGSDLFKDWSSN